MRKKDEIANPLSCLNKTHESEPVFVLRGNDPLSPAVIKHWVKLSIEKDLHASKLCEALTIATEMESWHKGS